MTWQEELRKLDEGLAAGNISADDYRVRRDQVLSSAVTSDDQQSHESGSGGDSTSAGSTQVIRPVTPQGGNQQGQVADNTQAVSPSESNRAQATPTWQPQHQPPAAARQSPQAAAGNWQQQPAAHQQPWNAPEQDATPPWGGSDLPPTGHQESSRVSQGPESFEPTRSGKKSRNILFAAIGVVVVLGLSVAVWALFIRPEGSGSTPAAAPPAEQSRQQASSPTQEPLPEPPPSKEEPADNAAALVDPKGESRDGGGKLDLSSLRKRELLPGSVVTALEKAGMNKGLLETTKVGDTTVGLYALEVESEKAARAVAHEYAISQQEGGLPATRKFSLQGVPVFGTDSGDSAVYRGVYVVYDRVIIVGVYGPDAQAVTDLFTGLLDKQVSHVPPTVREQF